MGLLDSLKGFNLRPRAAAAPEQAAPRALTLKSRPRRGKRPPTPAVYTKPALGLPFDGRRIFYYFLFALLFFALYLSFVLMQPFLHVIVLACIFSALVYPLYARIRLKTGLGDYSAAGLTLAMIVLLFCLPMVFFLSQLIPQGARSIRDLAQWLSGNNLDDLLSERVLPLFAWLNESVLTSLDMSLDIADIRRSLISLTRSAAQHLVSRSTGFVADSVTILLNFLLILLIMFFLLKDGAAMVNRLKRLTPLREEQDDNILQGLRRMAHAVLVGSFTVAALQGFVGGIGLALVGIQPLFWGAVMAATALVPVVGTGLVWIPAVIYLALSGKTAAAVFLAIWCGILVTSIDSVLRPLILRGGAKVSILFLFMSIFGGIKAFGPLGLIYGPLILGFMLAMINIYSSEFAEQPGHKSNFQGRPAPGLKPAARPVLKRTRRF